MNIEVADVHPHISEMKRYKIKTYYKKLLADTVTPVSIYLKLRDKFPNSLLLENSDYHSNENSFSYICCKPIAFFKIVDRTVYQKFPDGKEIQIPIDSTISVPDLINDFSRSFDLSPPVAVSPDSSAPFKPIPAKRTNTNHQIGETQFKFINNGLFGYINYDAIQFFEDIELKNTVNETKKIPTIYYAVYQHVIVIDHFKNELYIFDHLLNENKEITSIPYIESIINNKNFSSYHFKLFGKELSNFTDNEFLEIIESGKKHCKRGDVFQIVFSREYTQGFKGDEFNVYRALRVINPSPYLFYFDYGNFKLFGSSPEAQITVKDNIASIKPIAGTYKRTGDDKADIQLAEKLKNDPKENAEHIMLVDLARNDLSRNAKHVLVDKFKEIQYYSHVIHLVSTVSGRLNNVTHSMKIVADTFPAGTLSGTPKYKAMELIDEYEKGNRGFYGGAIGFMGFNGSFNHAIMIRSFLSKNNQLIYQAGAGILAKSNTKNELNEVNNKLAALKKAIQQAEEI